MRPELRVSSAHATQITDQDPAAAIKEVMAGYLGIISSFLLPTVGKVNSLIDN
jgi:hypothetical protein